MFRHLLIPLDGSDLAESVLPVALAFAERLHLQVTLLHVIERAAPATVHGAPHLREARAAEEYLEAIAARFRARGIETRLHVHSDGVGDVAGSIVAHAEEVEAGLIALCTHGRGGVRDILVGSIAQQVLRRGTRPIVLVRPRMPVPGSYECRTVLLPLDRTPQAEVAIEPAKEVAGAFRATIYLLTVVPTVATLTGDRAATARLLPVASAAMLELMEGEAVRYLASVAERLRAAGLSVQTAVRRGEPAAEIVAAAEALAADLVVLATHARAGWEAWWETSVGARVLGRLGRRPALLVRAGER
jgi:nucleotide-binding universal stress UspA family protein